MTIDEAELISLFCNDSHIENITLDTCEFKNTLNISETDGFPRSIVNTHILPAFFILLLAFGLPSNGLVIYVVLRHGLFRTVTNLFLANLAVADLLFLCFCVPFFTADYIGNGWHFGSLFCKFRLLNFYATSDLSNK